MRVKIDIGARWPPKSVLSTRCGWSLVSRIPTLPMKSLKSLQSFFDFSGFLRFTWFWQLAEYIFVNQANLSVAMEEAGDKHPDRPNDQRVEQSSHRIANLVSLVRRFAWQKSVCLLCACKAESDSDMLIVNTLREGMRIALLQQGGCRGQLPVHYQCIMPSLTIEGRLTCPLSSWEALASVSAQLPRFVYECFSRISDFSTLFM